MAATNVGGGDWAMAAEVFRKYDADGSGRLDRDELMSALRDLGMLQRVSASAAGRALAEMDANGDGVVSFEEFREAYSRMAKVQAEEQRNARVQRKPAAVPPNAATDPRLRASFQLFASWGAARGLSERAEKGEGLNSRQFQRACTAAGLPIEKAATDVVFTVARRGSRTLSYPRFLEALAQVALEAGLALDAVLDGVRACSPTTSASPAKEVQSKLPLSARASRPRSPGACVAEVLAAPRPCSATMPRPVPSPCPAAAASLTACAGATPATVAQIDKLQQGFASLQQLLEAVGPEDDESTIPAARPGGSPQGEADKCTRGIGAQQVQHCQHDEAAADDLLLNPTFQTIGQEGGDLGAFKLSLLSLLDQRCEAAEATCRAMVATRQEHSRQLASQLTATLGSGSSSAAVQQEVQMALRGYEARLEAAEGAMQERVRQVAGECRAAVAALEARVEVLRRGNEEGMGRMHEALLAIAKRVGTLKG